MFSSIFDFFRYTLALIATIYATVITLQSLWGWWVWLAGSDRYVSLLRRYLIVHGLRLRFTAFWGDVIISLLLCVVFLLTWRLHGLVRIGALNTFAHDDDDPPMPANPANPGELKMLPAAADATTGAVPAPTTGITPAVSTMAVTPLRQMSEMPREELEHLADEFGLDPTRFELRQHLVAAIHDRRQMIAAMDREAMLDVVRWGRRPVTASASKEQIAQEITRITSMRFPGLSQRGLVVLARMRGLEVRDDDPVPVLVKRLKKKEGLFAKINRKRRALLGGLVAKIVGEEGPTDYQFVPPPGGGGAAASPAATVSPAPAPAAGRPASIKQDIEESGLLGGITNRLKKSADSYVNQKLDEIEARIDRKLDEIDRRLAEWRDKEIANRIRILKITLWASVIVAVCSLIYTYIDVHFLHPPAPTPVETRSRPAAAAQQPPPAADPTPAAAPEAAPAPTTAPATAPTTNPS